MNQKSESESPAVAVARAHVYAWSNHDYDKARKRLADDVHVTVTTTQPMLPKTDTTGIDEYMDGLVKFGQIVVPGSARITESIGDSRNALLVVTVQATMGPGATPVPLTAARLYLLNEKGKIQTEQVIFTTLAS
jgi:hypothetical protein